MTVDAGTILAQEKRLRSFDGGVVISTRMLPAGPRLSVRDDLDGATGLIARGSGLSYAAASFGVSSASIGMDSCDAVLGYDSASGEVSVEPGISLGKLFSFLLEKGRYLAVQPGHSQISVGGCIAADVHGKNQSRDGTFRDQVRRIALFHPTHGTVELSRERELGVFEATCGGFGLTGVIVRADLATQLLPARSIRLATTLVGDPQEAAELMELQARTSTVTYSWHDFALGGGDGIVVSGQFEDAGPGRNEAGKERAISADWRARLPFSVQSRLTGSAINALFKASHRAGSRLVDLREAFFPAVGKESYFRTFGNRGFHEYQSVVPAKKLGEYVAAVTAAANRHRLPLTLVSGKNFGGEASLLRFSGPGVCFAVNVPRTGSSAAFMAELDDASIRLGCRPNIIKDSRLPRRVVEACYPEYDRLRALLSDWDQARLFRSELSERLGL